MREFTVSHHIRRNVAANRLCAVNALGGPRAGSGEASSKTKRQGKPETTLAARRWPPASSLEPGQHSSGVAAGPSGEAPPQQRRHERVDALPEGQNAPCGALTTGQDSGRKPHEKRYGATGLIRAHVALQCRRCAGRRAARGMGGRAVEGTGLENRRARKRTVGSNPTPSAAWPRSPSFTNVRENPPYRPEN